MKKEKTRGEENRGKPAERKIAGEEEAGLVDVLVGNFFRLFPP